MNFGIKYDADDIQPDLHKFKAFPLFKFVFWLYISGWWGGKSGYLSVSDWENSGKGVRGKMFTARKTEILSGCRFYKLSFRHLEDLTILDKEWVYEFDYIAGTQDWKNSDFGRTGKSVFAILNLMGKTPKIKNCYFSAAVSLEKRGLIISGTLKKRSTLFEHQQDLSKKCWDTRKRKKILLSFMSMSTISLISSWGVWEMRRPGYCRSVPAFSILWYGMVLLVSIGTLYCLNRYIWGY